MSLYDALPVCLQSTAVCLQGWRIQRSRYNEGFWAKLDEVEARGHLNHDEISAFRDQRLMAFVRHAVETTEHYSELFRNLGLNADDIQTVSDLQVLPILTKAEVQADPRRFHSSAIPKSHQTGVHTSGTTGSGLQFASTHQAQQEQWAVWWRYWRWHGIKPGTWCGYFGGRQIVPINQHRPPFWRINYPGKQIFFSAYHASPYNLTHYLEELQRRQPPWLHGYPSQLALLAAHIVETGISLDYRPKWITIGSENLMPHQVALIEKAFGLKPLQHYGMAEAIANISQCESGRLHVDEDFAAVEFIPAPAGNFARIVGTNFSNFATPLIRYDVGDHAVLTNETCDCGRPGRIVASLDGRKDDYVVTRSGARIGRLAHMFDALLNVREAQIRQFRPGEVEVLVVKSPSFAEYDETILRRELASRLGYDMEVEIHYVDSLKRTSRGKLRFVVSEIAKNSDVGRYNETNPSIA